MRRGVDSLWIMPVEIALVNCQRPIKFRSSLSCQFCTLLRPVVEFSIKNIREFQVCGEPFKVGTIRHASSVVKFTTGRSGVRHV